MPPMSSVPTIVPEGLYTATNFGKLFGLCPSAARKILAKNRATLRPAKIGRCYFVLGSDVLRWVEIRRDSA